jgi:hypothetical protein
MGTDAVRLGRTKDLNTLVIMVPEPQKIAKEGSATI